MKNLSAILLILGLIFSQLLTIEFNLNHGFIFHRLTLKVIPLVEFAGKFSTETKLTSTIVGYISFIIFGVLHTNKVKSPETFKSSLMFTGISIIVSFFEFTSILEDIYGNYQGKFFRIGWPIFILGVLIFIKKYITKK